MNIEPETTTTVHPPAAYATIADEIIPEVQFCKELKIDVRTARRWHALGYGPKRIKIGKKIYYRRTSILRWMDEQQGR